MASKSSHLIVDAIISFLVINFAIFIVCGEANSNSNLIGKWFPIKATIGDKKQDISHMGKIEFFNDQTYVENRMSGKWIILEDGRIKMQDSFGNVDFGLLQGENLIIDNHKTDNFKITYLKFSNLIKDFPLSSTMKQLNDLLIENVNFYINNCKDKKQAEVTQATSNEVRNKFNMLKNITKDIENEKLIGFINYLSMENNNIDKIDIINEEINNIEGKAVIGTILYYKNGNNKKLQNTLEYVDGWKVISIKQRKD